MLSPKFGPIPLLPQDRAIIDMLGITEVEYRNFIREAREKSYIAPGTPTAFGPFTFFVVSLVIGVVLNTISALIAPTVKQREPGRVESRQVDGQDIVTNTRFTPKSGFDGLQNVVEIGSTIPLVYTKRQLVAGVYYGGVRVNTNLLWSQLRSLGGGQMLRAMFMLSEATVVSIDPLQLAFGNNLIGSYNLTSAGNTSGRVSVYFSGDGGRLRSADHIAGRLPAFDDGNAESAGGADVFALKSVGNALASDFCYAFKPSNQTQFGLYAPCGNGLTYRINPVVRPVAQVFLTRHNNDGDQKVNCVDDLQVKAQRDKQQAAFNTRANFLGSNGGLVSVSQGQQIVYLLDRRTDSNQTFTQQANNAPDAIIGTLDAAQAISSRLRSYDDALVIGETYKLGTALLVCTARSENNYVSDVDNTPIGGGRNVSATFEVLRAGIYRTTAWSGSPNRGNPIWHGTNMSHLFRVAIATFIIERPAKVVEIGLKHTLGIRFSGLCNFREMLSQSETDRASCEFWQNNIIGSGQSISAQQYTSGTYTGAEERYSFFRLGYRIAGSSDSFTQLTQCFGARGISQQAIYNYIRMEMPDTQRWEYELFPLSGWEIRNGYASGSLEVLDYRYPERSFSDSGVTVVFNGVQVSRTQNNFKLNQTNPIRSMNIVGPPELPYADLVGENSMVDGWGKLAELFIYEEISASTDAPEHEIAYVNVVSVNDIVPNYNGLSILGINIRAGREFSQLSQLSVYVTAGINSLNTFPAVLFDLLTNTRYGVGAFMSSQQIDTASFTEMALWTRNRRYYFDGAIAERTSVRAWAVNVARNYLLDVIIRNGKIALQPAVWFDRPEPITGLFTSGNILEDSFEMTYLDTQDRLPPRVSVKWREERANNSFGQSGTFPILREVTVQESTTPDGAPLESIDISDYCTSQQHAIDLGKFICRSRRLITHTIRFKTLPDQAALDLGRSFKLGLETVTYEQPNNGVITADGTVTTWPPLSDGLYNVLLWTGSGNALTETTLSIANGRAAPSAPGAVFCVRSVHTESIVYRVQSLAFDEDGNIEVTASHFPVDSNGYSLISANWNAGFTIQGAI